MLPRRLSEPVAILADQELVGRDQVLARLERAQGVLKRRVQPAHRLHDQLDLGVGQYLLHGCLRALGHLAQIQHARHLEPGPFCQLVHACADGSIAQNRQFHRIITLNMSLSEKHLYSEWKHCIMNSSKLQVKGLIRIAD